MEESCKTKYPVVLIHGAGFRDLKWPVYWGRIPKALAERGADIHYGLQDSWASIEVNAQAIRERLLAILEQTGSERVNVIAHSKGGLEARMVAASLGMGPRIASVTTIATPHRGSKTIDRLLKAPDALFQLAAFAVNSWMRAVGDQKPDFREACRGFSTQSMAVFNEQNPDSPEVFYQSYTGVMRRPSSDFNLWLANFIVRKIEGENDGLVTAESARWGERFTILRGVGRRGVSHLDEIDLRRAPLSRKPGAGVRDICDVYIEIVRGLKERGC